jgi:hypothetical protein
MHFITAPTGTMANNGAVTLGTALDRTYSEGCWMWFPAGAVATGVPAAAAWLWVVMSSTTVGTVFNSTYTTGNPTAGTATAYATTGPGAFTGDTTEHGVTIPIAAGLMGANGVVTAGVQYRHNSTAGTKTGRIRFSGSAGTILVSNAPTASTGLRLRAEIGNSGATGAQSFAAEGIVFSFSGILTVGNTTIDTSVATSIYLSMQSNTATDYQVMGPIRVTLDRLV